MKKLIVLTGMMGCGKSTVGALLSQKIGFDFVDIDSEIEQAEKMSVSNIFNEFGEQYFRKLEKKTISKFLNRQNLVLSLGGGSFEDEETRKILKKEGMVIYLKATPDCLFERIKSEIHRPLLHKNFSVETLSFILKKRADNYEKAHRSIDTCNKTPDEIVENIIRIIK